ncbi:C39 family peptidase [uncultured Adlercreutzia sp.]|uniref:C39 family peptidase n=1 Tax=uncultured Adlercreutzia sp. TaxID=875803 RepID=UPI0026F3CAD6|nr:C39 family peptidase [uncultured Adlercreutzia sp.]
MEACTWNLSETSGAEWGCADANPYSRAAWSAPATRRDDRAPKRATPTSAFAAGRDDRASRRSAPTSAPAAPARRPAVPAEVRARCVSAAPRLAERRRVVGLVAAVAVAALVLGAALQLADGGTGSATSGDGLVSASGASVAARAGDGSEAASTPKSQWRAGELPFLYQIDPQYGAAPYAGADVAESGCGPTSLAMVYVALTGKTDYDPASMAAFSEEHGFVEDGLTAWRLMTEGASMLGLSSRELPADAGVLVGELQAGHPVICTVRPGDFTDTGHFLVLAGVADNGELVIHDPNSPANSARTWEVDRVLAQCANLWAFS